MSVIYWLGEKLHHFVELIRCNLNKRARCGSILDSDTFLLGLALTGVRLLDKDVTTSH
jgi:hypothetical protein